MHDFAGAARSVNRRDQSAESSAHCDPCERYAGLLADLQSAIELRREREQRLAAEPSASGDDRERELQERISEAEAVHTRELQSLDGNFEAQRSALLAEAEQAEAAGSEEHLTRVREIEGRYYREITELEAKHQDSAWVTSSVLDDAAEDSPLRQFERATQVLERTREQQSAELQGVETSYQAALDERGLRPQGDPVAESLAGSLDEAQAKFTAHTESARQALLELAGLRIPRLFSGYAWLLVLLAIAGLAFAPIYLLLDPALFGVPADRGVWEAVTAGAAAACALAILGTLYLVGASQQSAQFEDARQFIVEARSLHEQWREFAAREHKRQVQAFETRQSEFAAQRQQALGRYQRAHDERRAELDHERARELHAENSRFGEWQQAVRARFAEAVARHAEDHARRRQGFLEEAESRRAALTAEYNDYAQNRRRRQAEIWHQLKTDWDSATRRFEAGIRRAHAECNQEFPDWATMAAGGWRPAEQSPRGIRRGEYLIDLEQWEGAIPADMRLAPRTTRLTLPSVTAFPEASSLLLRTSGAASRDEASRLLQNIVLRWLAHVPPGKLRLTILDPLGLGESFAGFMHLADFDELLVTKRIWTEPDQIEQQLADLTQHMENVLQKYLRNEFATIEEYNAFAGEVAEPYRLLVVTDFPAKFSELAARRLTSIITSGRRCGIFTLLSQDLRRDLPHGFDPAVLHESLPALNWARPPAMQSSLADLLEPDGVAPAVEPQAEVESEPAFRAAAGILSRWPLTIDEPPPPEQFTSLVRKIGQASKAARRVEVAFDRIAPPGDQLWTRSSRDGIEVPLGRAGATKLQHLRLGKGTSQHMLIAGKTGSGKSTFLHCLITNLALHYSPDEVRFALIDFKKGVEFKDYAALQLPHADVIAIESDREFGVSVLQRLDSILQERGDLFRRQGVQDLAGYRAANPETPLPRLLLVIDEFQEFFVEEDRLSQTAALLLDRLIRQGRAFGMHVVLGSQTLGGAYSLARSTMGQVAVRVALQCSEADAHLILSEENTAARLLTRPGEAIYNDANGLVEGNHPFQIAWLPDHERETWLRRLQAAAQVSGRRDPAPIVFEGNIPSDPGRNAALVELLSAPADNVQPELRSLVPQAWLGEAVEIKPPTALKFERRNGANLLLVGQDADAALGIMCTAAVALAAQSAVGDGGTGPAIVVLDGTQPDEPDATAWKELADQYGDRIAVHRPREAGRALQELTEDLQRRLAEPDAVHVSRFLVVHHLSRFRDLRKTDDDFGMSFGGSAEKPRDPSRLFADLLANGPAVGLHVIVWSDSANTVERWFSRTALRELENRVVFQMNSSDSSNLIDSPAASRLGPHRALLYREETGASEKFRPYRRPDQDWLRSLKAPRQKAVAPHANEGLAPVASDVAQDLSEFRIL